MIIALCFKNTYIIKCTNKCTKTKQLFCVNVKKFGGVKSLINNSLVVDGCVFAEGDFKGCTPKVANSGLDAFFLTIPHSDEGFAPAANAIGNIYSLTDKDKKFVVARTKKDIEDAAKAGKIAIILAFQDPFPIENSLDKLRVFYELGVRVVQLTYNKANYIGTGGLETIDKGLMDFGSRIIKEMNHLGMIIDLSHCSRLTALAAIEESEDPVVFSHACVRNLTESPRNRTDEELKLLAQKGGVIGLSPWGPLCWKKEKGVQPSLDDYIDHVDYVVDLIGIDHIAFGGDSTIDDSDDSSGIVEQATLYPAVVEEYNKKVGVHPSVRHAIGFNGAGEIENVVEAMLKRGYKEEDISKFLGGNFLRVISNVWK